MTSKRGATAHSGGDKNTLRDEILKIVHLCGCQCYSEGANEPKGTNDGLTKVEELEKIATQELFNLLKTEQIKELENLIVEDHYDDLGITRAIEKRIRELEAS